MDTPVVLMIGRDAVMRTLVRFLVQDEGCEVVEVTAVTALIAALRARPVALVVVVEDAMVDGNATTRAVRDVGYCPPIILLTRGPDRATRRRALALGVLDIIGLPVSPRDLQARLGAALQDQRRRQARAGGRAIRAGGLMLRGDRREVGDEAGWSVRLTAREAALLRALMGTPGRPLGRQDLLDAVWGEGYDGDGNVLDAYVRRLRVKLRGARAARSCVRTLRGQGYLFDARRAPRVASQDEVAPHVLYIGDTVDAPVLQMLRHAGYSGMREGAPRARARAARPLLVLIECEMGEGDAADLARRLRGDPRTAAIPLIACATASLLHERRAELAVDDYLVAPFTRDEVALRVERLIGCPPSAALAPATPA